MQLGLAESMALRNERRTDCKETGALPVGANGDVGPQEGGKVLSG